MSRYSYRTALRAKGIRPLPAPHKLKSSLAAPEHRTIDATVAAMEERSAAA